MGTGQGSSNCPGTDCDPRPQGPPLAGVVDCPRCVVQDSAICDAPMAWTFTSFPAVVPPGATPLVATGAWHCRSCRRSAWVCLMPTAMTNNVKRQLVLFSLSHRLHLVASAAPACGAVHNAWTGFVRVFAGIGGIYGAPPQSSPLPSLLVVQETVQKEKDALTRRGGHRAGWSRGPILSQMRRAASGGPCACLVTSSPRRL